MMVRMLFVAVCGLVLSASSAQAQGLIWSLPADGEWVRYEGTVTQVNGNPDNADSQVAPQPWTRHLWIKSLNAEQRQIDGAAVTCRWIELKALTGRARDGQLDPGPTGLRIYKVLVPEYKVLPRAADDDGIENSMLPIVEGYRQIGQLPPERITSGVLQVYPVLTLLEHYKPEAINAESSDPEPLDLPAPIGTVEATRYLAYQQRESTVARSTNEAELWVSKDIPFGLAQWKVTLTQESKESVQPRSEFKQVDSVVEEMKAQEKGTNAQSELVIPNGE